MDENVIESLKKNHLFTGLSEIEILQILSKINYKLKSYRKNDIVFLNNEYCKDLVILLNGSLRSEFYKKNGSSVMIEVHKAPAVIAPAFLFGKQQCFPVNVVSECNSTILLIPKNMFLEEMLSEREILLNYLNMVCSKTQFLAEKVRFYSAYDLRQRIIHYLINNYDLEEGKSIRLSITLKELSEILGVERPSISRILKQLCEVGLIEYCSKKIKILNFTELRCDLE